MLCILIFLLSSNELLDVVGNILANLHHIKVINIKWRKEWVKLKDKTSLDMLG